MKTIETPIKDLLVLEPKIFSDKRGYFFETFNHKLFEENGLHCQFVQDNESCSEYGVVRGLHYQLAPFAQAKLVRVIKGAVYDVALDLRRGSPTFGQWFGIELNEDNKLQMFIPRGFAHGFSVLSPIAVFSYKCDQYYAPNAERGIAIDDPLLNIDWKIEKESLKLSEKDRKNPKFVDSEYNFILKQ